MTEHPKMPARAFASLRTDAHERSPSGTAVLWGILVLSIAYGIIILSRVWVVGPDGISRGTGTVPYWDFSNLWGGAKLAAKGQLYTLFDTTAYRQEQANLFGAPVITGEWSYPPTMLLVGAPLAILPVGMAYLLWISGTILLFMRSPCASCTYPALTRPSRSSARPWRGTSRWSRMAR